jgi:N-glycosylase/DNA lyase
MDEHEIYWLLVTDSLVGYQIGWELGQNYWAEFQQHLGQKSNPA